MFAMDPGSVRVSGGRIGEVGRLARGAADTASHLEAPRARVSVHDAATAFIEVWADALLALATELRILDELCACSAFEVRRDDEAARSSYAAPLGARTRAAVAG